MLIRSAFLLCNIKISTKTISSIKPFHLLILMSIVLNLSGFWWKARSNWTKLSYSRVSRLMKGMNKGIRRHLKITRLKLVAIIWRLHPPALSKVSIETLELNRRATQTSSQSKGWSRKTIFWSPKKICKFKFT